MEIGACAWFDERSQAFEASQVLYVLALAVSKVSVLILIDRIFAGLEWKHETLLSKLLMGVITIWSIGSALAVSVECDADQILPGTAAAVCPGSVSHLTQAMYG